MKNVIAVLACVLCAGVGYLAGRFSQRPVSIVDQSASQRPGPVRTVDEALQAYWLDLLEAGVPEHELALALERSAEFLRLREEWREAQPNRRVLGR